MPRAETREKTIVGVLALASVAGYLLVSYYTYKLGFPLDDAWIHQVYARSLAETGQWQFLGGASSGGSTGPLWSGLISLSYILGLSPLWGTYLLGVLLLWLLGMAGMKLFTYLMPEGKKQQLYLGMLIVFEWHLVWAAGSGMETLLFSVLILWCCLAVMHKPVYGRLGSGALVGLSVWVRPGGLTLLGIVGLDLLLRKANQKRKVSDSFLIALGFLVFFLPYLLFNQQISGDWWPNTFYAKQAEYAVLREVPLLKRFAELSLQPLIGAGLLFLPGVGYFLGRKIKTQEWKLLAAPVWGVGYLLLYSLRLPVIYQHGRYLMPVIPVLYVFGYSGMVFMIRDLPDKRWKFILSRSWIVSLLVLEVVFWGLGARAYGQDVGMVETEMVRTAKWIERHIEDDGIVAAHDIGALGYFSDQEIVDLAGLITPDVIPFIREETELAEYLDEKNANYLVAFPGWYPYLTKISEPVYQSGGRFAPALGAENMVVYRWRP